MIEDTQKSILAFVCERENTSLVAIAKALGIGVGSTSRHLSQLAHKRLVVLDYAGVAATAAGREANGGS